MKTIFVDCFDTLVHRREHPHQVVRRWAKCMSRIYPKLDEGNIYADRQTLCKTINIVTIGIQALYDALAGKYLSEGLIENVEQFKADARKLELYCEIACLYQDKPMVNYLQKQVRGGYRVYCITDIHYASEDVKFILEQTGIDFLSGVVSSADYGYTKAEGGLYQKVIDELQVKASNCIMYGDNRMSDVLRARENGLQAKHRSYWFHITRLRVENKLGIQRKYSIQSIGYDIRKHTDDYEEFALLFWAFSGRLYRDAKEAGFHKIVFLSREGYFLRQCFEIYQETNVPAADRLDTDYLKSSRRVAKGMQDENCRTSAYRNISVPNYLKAVGFSAEQAVEIAHQFGFREDVIQNFPESVEAQRINTELKEVIKNRIQENRAAYISRVESLADDNRMCLVDVGWAGTMQHGIAKLFPQFDMKGFYMGIKANLPGPPEINRKGLIFDQDRGTAYFDVFRANTQFYEQLLSAPHGSAVSYYFSDGNPAVNEEWVQEEENLYKNHIAAVQQKMRTRVNSISTLTDKLDDDRGLARVMLKSTLIQSKKRLEFMKTCSKGFVWNFQQEHKGLSYNTNSVHVSKTDIIIHPDRYLRYVAKVGFAMDKKGLGGLGRLLMSLYYGYVRVVCRI